MYIGNAKGEYSQECGDSIYGETAYDLAYIYEQEDNMQKSREAYQQASDCYERLCTKFYYDRGIGEHHAKRARYLGLIYEKLGKLEDSINWLKCSAWMYEKVLGTGNQMTLEVRLDIDRVSDNTRPAEGLLSWQTRKERARQSGFPVFKLVKVACKEIPISNRSQN
jgi:tetratricopeptide (TPR) repeat protein